MRILKKRLMRKSQRGIYIQDKALLESVFNAGTHFQYVIDKKNKNITIVPSIGGNNIVSKRNLKTFTKPVIDIRNKEALEVLSNGSSYVLTIYENKVLIEAYVENINDLPSTSNKVLSFSYKSKEYFKNKLKTNEILLSKKQLSSVANGYEQIGCFENLFVDVTSTNASIVKSNLENFQLALNCVSLFSASGMLDKAFVDEGFDINFAIDIDPGSCESYKYNIGDHILCDDITKININNIPNATVVIGGVPCTLFSNCNRRTNVLYQTNDTHILLDKYIEIVNLISPFIFMIENVPQFITAAKGKFINKVKSSLPNYHINYQILNAADYGTPQLRERAIIIGSKGSLINIPKIIRNKYKSVREAFSGLNKNIPNQLDYTISKPSTKDKISYIPQGGNIFDIPKDIRPNGTHSDVYRRLEWDKPSITLPNVRKSMILHPEENRCLSVREVARLQGMEDDFIFKGSLSSKQMQVSNGVPFQVSKIIAKTIKKAIEKLNNKPCYNF